VAHGRVSAGPPATAAIAAGAGLRGALRDYRSLAAVIVALALAQTGVAALSAFAPLTLASRGVDAAGVGLAAAGYAAGFLVGAMRAAGVVRAIGHIRAFAAFAAIAGVVMLVLYPFGELAAWVLAQAALGLCVSMLLTAGESWIAEIAPTEKRGALLAFYLVISKLGQIAGPFMIAAMAPGTAAGFMTISAVMVASLVPVCATRRVQPSLPSSTPYRLINLWRATPAAVLAALAAGAVNGSVLQLYALYANGSGEGGPVQAAEFNAALAAGAIAGQWPAGALSDRRDRRLVIAALAGVAALASLGLGVGASTFPWWSLMLLAAIWGAGSMSFYGVAVAHAADRAAPGETTGMMAGILVVWAIGAIAGPLTIGAVMSGPVGAGGLFFCACAVLSALATAMLVRRSGMAATPEDQKAPFTAAPATSSAFALLDPRSQLDDPQLDLFAAPEQEPAP
jgi:MFS family permease